MTARARATIQAAMGSSQIRCDLIAPIAAPPRLNCLNLCSSSKNICEVVMIHMRRAKLITTLRLLIAGMLIAGFFFPWVLHKSGPDDPGFGMLLLAIYLPLLLIADPFKGIFIISAYLTVGYILVDLISIAVGSLGRGASILLFCAGGGLLTIFTWIPPSDIGGGYRLILAGILLGWILEAADQEKRPLAVDSDKHVARLE